jgi:hypothetical protein
MPSKQDLLPQMEIGCAARAVDARDGRRIGQYWSHASNVSDAIRVWGRVLARVDSAACRYSKLYIRELRGKLNVSDGSQAVVHWLGDMEAKVERAVRAASGTAEHTCTADRQRKVRRSSCLRSPPVSPPRSPRRLSFLQHRHLCLISASFSA